MRRTRLPSPSVIISGCQSPPRRFACCQRKSSLWNELQRRSSRSGPVSSLALDESPEACTDEILSVCERLERLTPEIGSGRVESSEYYIRAQNNIVELVAGKCRENFASRRFVARCCARFLLRP